MLSHCVDAGQAGLGEEQSLEMGPDLTKAAPGVGPGGSKTQHREMGRP